MVLRGNPRFRSFPIPAPRCPREAAFYASSMVSAASSLYESNCILRELSGAGQIDDARNVFDGMLRRDEYSWNTMIGAYSGSGRLAEARSLFEMVPTKSSITWSSLISGYSRFGHEDEAFRLFKKMQLEGQKPSQFTLGSILRACSILGLLRQGEQVHGYTIKTGFNHNDFVVTGLVDMYAKCKLILEAEYLFETVRERSNPVLWTAMLTGYSQSGDGFRAMECFRDMVLKGIQPNQYTFPSILTACGVVSASDFGAQVHSCIIRSGYVTNSFVQSALIDMYSKSGNLRSAKMVLDAMEVDDIVSWNSIIVGFVRHGFVREALTLFKKMHERGIKIDDFTYPSILNSFASSEDLKSAKSIHCMIIKNGFEAYKLVNNAVIDMYAKQNSMKSALKVFSNMPNRDIISWTSVVTGYAFNGSYEEAIRLYCDMRISEIDPDEIILSNILSSCAELTSLELGQQLHVDFIKSGIGSSISVDNSLVTMYAKCGSIEEAKLVFDSMEARNVISWTALIVGYAQNGKAKESLDLYHEMTYFGLKPDYVTFIGVLFACSHAGLVESGRQFFDLMVNFYRIKPGPEHYSCIIDLLGRSGRLKEAEDLLNRMTEEPDATVWKALLGACRAHKNLEMGERAAEKLFMLEPMNAMPYVLLANMYFSANRLEDAAKLWKIMKSRGITKEPGLSWIELNSKVHTFTSEDRAHPEMKEIYLKVDEVISSIKKAGYVPDINFALHDVDEKGREHGLAYHSEKLAVAFGLMVLPHGGPIRIFKNLRVCGDCHAAMKFVSVVFNRHIILRDSNCFHHFKEGKCSCGDYW
ncbi:hypothetical protein SAY86_012979 [Trapa natans]|uniref:DYW domain-containing protein n=1 Tax=Trapa natans TaxID=22666 RepID=A0AAN7LXZ6_TRANT|nr:hypothetical protein SAY86_012979 [Trapa natans]